CLHNRGTRSSTTAATTSPPGSTQAAPGSMNTVSWRQACGHPTLTSMQSWTSATEGSRSLNVSQVHRFPRLDCHAHIAPDVTPAQIAALEGAFIFAMTRSPAEARFAARRHDGTVVWGYGAH